MSEVQKDLFGKDTATISWQDNKEGPKRGIQVIEKENEYELKEYRKTGKLDKTIVPKENASLLRECVKATIKVGESAKDKVLKKWIIEKKELHKIEKIPIDTFVDLFNGGPFRSKYYFPLLYHPLKVLDYYKEVEHGQGTIKRLK